MSQENVEIVRRIWRASDAGSVLDFYDPAIIWESHFGPISGPYHGHDGVRQFFREWTEPLETFRATAETFVDAGDSVVVDTRVWAKGKSGMEGEMRQGMVYTLRNGLVTRVDLYESKADALEAVGLSEQDAHADS
jgi:ketosteroid isomerase-like protein